MTQTSDPRTVQSIDGLEAQLRQLLEAKNKLTELFKLQERSFALDGHLIGSIGEVICSYLFKLRLLPNSTEQFDAVTDDGKFVQIKISSNESYRFKRTHLENDCFLILLKLHATCENASHAARRNPLITIKFIGLASDLNRTTSKEIGEKNARGQYVVLRAPTDWKIDATLPVCNALPSWIAINGSE